MRKVGLLAAIGLMLAAPLAAACPMCFEALKGDTGGSGNLPLAFYYSILFMLSMPFLIVAGFSMYFYYLRRNVSAEPAALAT